MAEVLMTASPAQPVSKRRLIHIPELDGLRGIAAIMVFFHHVCFTSINPTKWGPGVRLVYNVSQLGSYGVDVFFVLSGFLITSLLIEDRGDPAYYHNFYWKRALRILPLYAICLLGVLFFIPGIGRYVLLSALFLSNFAQIFHIASEGPFWTLAIEEQFYLLWPTVVRKRSIKQLSRWALGIGLSAIVLRLIAACFGHHNYYFTFFHCDGLALGAYFACRFEDRHQIAPGTVRAGFWSLFLSSVALLTAATFLLRDPAKLAFAAAALQTGITLLCGSLVGYLITHSGSRSLSFLRAGGLPLFGLISYALYMIHLYVLQAYDHLRGPLPDGNLPAYLIRFCSVAAITIALCVASRYFIELPATSLRKYVLKRPLPPIH